MTPEPVAVPVPVWPVVGSVSVAPSATIVTTAGLTALTMSTTEPGEATELVSVVVVDAAGVVEVVVWLPALVTTYVPAEARNADASTAPATKPGPAAARRRDGPRPVAGAGSAAGGVSATGCAAGAVGRRDRDSVRLRLRFGGGG